MNHQTKQLLDSFVEYCEMYPDMRFWQALRNWAGVHTILVTDVLVPPDAPETMRDTFYFDGLDK